MCVEDNSSHIFINPLYLYILVNIEKRLATSTVNLLFMMKYITPFKKGKSDFILWPPFILQINNKSRVGMRLDLNGLFA